MTRRAFSLRQKLLALVMLTTFAALVVALGGMIAYELQGYHRRLIADLTTQAELLGRTIAPALTFDDARVAKENLDLLRSRPQVGAAAIYTARGAVFASYLRGRGDAAAPRLPEAEGVRVEGAQVLVFKRILNDGEILGTVFLRADYEMGQRVLANLGIASLVLAVALCLAYLLSKTLQRMVTDPVLAIAQVAREVVERRDYSKRARKQSGDEVGTLAESFNGMLAEIERRTSELQDSNRKLGSEVAERARAEQEVLRLNQELEARVRERTAQLESANQELEAFCYSVSHDLRAPLRAIDGFSQALVEDFSESVPEGGRRYLDRIQTSTRRMGQLIEDLLNLSRVSRGALERRPVDVGEVARQVLAEIEQREPERRVEVQIWDGMAAEADPRLLRAALENLLANAWKFTAKTAAPRIEVGCLRDGERSTYFVRDNGAGFDMAYADKLFGAFQRLHAVDDFPGTGIGLATVQRIVNRHGGRIWADGQVGKGAVFFFTLAYHDDRRKEPRQGQGGAT
ncbi:MAG: sensor histidine kinase [Burkholderiales bacterium]